MTDDNKITGNGGLRDIIAAATSLADTLGAGPLFRSLVTPSTLESMLGKVRRELAEMTDGVVDENMFQLISTTIGRSAASIKGNEIAGAGLPEIFGGMVASAGKEVIPQLLSERNFDKALLAWKAVLGLVQGQPAILAAVVEASLPVVCPYFALDAGFTKNFLGAIDDACGKKGMFDLASNELVVKDVPEVGFLVVADKGVALINEGGLKARADNGLTLVMNAVEVGLITKTGEPPIPNVLPLIRAIEDAQRIRQGRPQQPAEPLAKVVIKKMGLGGC